MKKNFIDIGGIGGLFTGGIPGFFKNLFSFDTKRFYYPIGLIIIHFIAKFIVSKFEYGFMGTILSAILEPLILSFICLTFMYIYTIIFMYIKCKSNEKEKTIKELLKNSLIPMIPLLLYYIAVIGTYGGQFFFPPLRIVNTVIDNFLGLYIVTILPVVGWYSLTYRSFSDCI